MMGVFVVVTLVIIILVLLCFAGRIYFRSKRLEKQLHYEMKDVRNIARIGGNGEGDRSDDSLLNSKNFVTSDEIYKPMDSSA